MRVFLIISVCMSVRITHNFDNKNTYYVFFAIYFYHLCIKVKIRDDMIVNKELIISIHIFKLYNLNL